MLEKNIEYYIDSFGKWFITPVKIYDVEYNNKKFNIKPTSKNDFLFKLFLYIMSPIGELTDNKIEKYKIINIINNKNK